MSYWCQRKIRDKNGVITSYIIGDMQNNVIVDRREISSSELKEMMKAKRIKIENLKLTADNRIINSTDDPESWQKLEQEELQKKNLRKQESIRQAELKHKLKQERIRKEQDRREQDKREKEQKMADKYINEIRQAYESKDGDQEEALNYVFKKMKRKAVVGGVGSLMLAALVAGALTAGVNKYENYRDIQAAEQIASVEDSTSKLANANSIFVDAGIDKIKVGDQYIGGFNIKDNSIKLNISGNVRTQAILSENQIRVADELGHNKLVMNIDKNKFDSIQDKDGNTVLKWKKTGINKWSITDTSGNEVAVVKLSATYNMSVDIVGDSDIDNSDIVTLAKGIYEYSGVNEQSRNNASMHLMHTTTRIMLMH